MKALIAKAAKAGKDGRRTPDYMKSCVRKFCQKWKSDSGSNRMATSQLASHSCPRPVAAWVQDRRGLFQTFKKKSAGAFVVRFLGGHLTLAGAGKAGAGSSHLPKTFGSKNAPKETMPTRKREREQKDAGPKLCVDQAFRRYGKNCKKT